MEIKNDCVLEFHLKKERKKWRICVFSSFIKWKENEEKYRENEGDWFPFSLEKIDKKESVWKKGKSMEKNEKGYGRKRKPLFNFLSFVNKIRKRNVKVYDFIIKNNVKR